MPIEEIVSKTTIEFPRPLSLKEIEKLLRYISDKQPANIHYHVSRHRDLIKQDAQILIRNGTVTVTGDIRSFRTPISFDSFQSKPSEKNKSYTSAIAFQMVPGWELSDYRQEVKDLWDHVREVVTKYFSQSELH